VVILIVGAGSTLITSQLPTDTWHEVIGEPTFADAILDRLVHTPTASRSKGRRAPSSLQSEVGSWVDVRRSAFR
jgi:DNA replication protein DnaC